MDNLRDAWRETQCGRQYDKENITLNEAWKMIESGQYELDEGFQNAATLAKQLVDVIQNLSPQQATQIINMLNQSLGM
jgi:hypothetical protein